MPAASEAGNSDTPLRATFKINLNGKTVAIGTVGQSPYYVVAQDALKQLRGLLNDMGLTFKSRPKTAASCAGRIDGDHRCE